MADEEIDILGLIEEDISSEEGRDERGEEEVPKQQEHSRDEEVEEVEKKERETTQSREAKKERKQIIFEGETFSIEEVEEASPKTVLVIAGEKGHGKTTLALSMPGNIAVFAYDRKSAPIKFFFYKGDERIRIFDMLHYYNPTSKNEVLEHAVKSVRYARALLNYLKEENSVDWIVIDNFDVLTRLCEMTARYYNHLQPFGGTGEVGYKLFDERNFYIRTIFQSAFETAKRGVIYTLYLTTQEIVKNGQVMERTRVPKWVDAVLYETDVALVVSKIPDERRFLCHVLTSKNEEEFPTGLTVDITDIGFKAFKDKNRVVERPLQSKVMEILGKSELVSL
mgnify:CR=1 FL=1